MLNRMSSAPARCGSRSDVFAVLKAVSFSAFKVAGGISAACSIIWMMPILGCRFSVQCGGCRCAAQGEESIYGRFHRFLLSNVRVLPLNKRPLLMQRAGLPRYHLGSLPVARLASSATVIAFPCNGRTRLGLLLFQPAAPGMYSLGFPCFLAPSESSLKRGGLATCSRSTPLSAHIISHGRRCNNEKNG